MSSPSKNKQRMLIPDPVQNVIDTHLCNTVLYTVFFFLLSGVFIMCFGYLIACIFLCKNPEGSNKKKKQSNAAKKSELNVCIGIWPHFLLIYLCFCHKICLNLRGVTAELVFEWKQEV